MYQVFSLLVNNQGHRTHLKNCLFPAIQGHTNIQSTAIPWREATGLITEGGLSWKFTSHGFYGENIFHNCERDSNCVRKIFWIDVNYFWQNVTLDWWWAEIIWQHFVVSWVSICKSTVGYDDVKWRSELFPLFLWFMDTWNSSTTGLEPTSGGLYMTWF